MKERKGEYEESTKCYQMSLEIKVLCFGTGHASVAGTYNNMGAVEGRLGNFQKALELYEKSLEINIKSLGESHVSCVDTKYNIANIYRGQGNDVKAVELFNEVAAIHANVYGPEHHEEEGEEVDNEIQYEEEATGDEEERKD